MKNHVLDQAANLLNAQPFSKMLGARIEHIDTQSVSIGLNLRDDLRQQNGFAHGGLLSYLADNALAFAGALELGTNVLTGEFKINYIRPAVGTLLMAKARVVHASRRQAVCRCEIYVHNEGIDKLVAAAQGTIIKIEGSDTGER